jgi:sugar phosphate isomerase/epimerase
MSISRRDFVTRASTTAAAALLPTNLLAQVSASCPFRLSVINDEISPDFDHACYVASHDFGLSWIELRNLWGKSLTSLSSDQLTEAKRILAKYNLKVTDLASPLFKTDLPGAPPSKESPHRDKFSPDKPYKEQDDLLDQLIVLSKTFGTDRIRCFDFWRLQDQKPWRAEINRKLIEAAEKCEKNGLILLLENEMACNTGSGPEAAEILKAIPNKNFMLNWDAGNSGTFAGDIPYPNDYEMLPKKRIGHVHCKNVIRTPEQKMPFEWRPVDVGLVDWVGQFKALKRDGYHYAVSLETHWRGGPGNTPDEVAESSTRISMKGLKACLTKAGISC